MQQNKIGDFSNNLKNSKNIAIVCDTTKGLDSLCAAIGLRELITAFLKEEENFSAEVYFLSPLPEGSEEFTQNITIFDKIGEITLYIKFPSENVEKVTYDFDNKKKEFNLGLTGFKKVKGYKEKIEFKEERENFNYVVGIGFEDKKEFETIVPYVKTIKNQFIFNHKNLKGDSLVEGVVDIYFTEKVKPTKLASLALFTGLKS